MVKIKKWLNLKKKVIEINKIIFFNFKKQNVG